jgi:hypothetical protein
MGGLGSGGRRVIESKTTTSAAIAIDIRLLQKAGALVPGYSHSCTTRFEGRVSRVGLEARDGYILVTYQWTSINGGPRAGGPVDRIIPYANTPCNYGGKRRWFRCPKCKKRAAVIFFHHRACACRRCHDLVYPSQRQKSTDRALHRAQLVRIRLGGSANLSQPFPNRPKGMWRSTYARLRLGAERDTARWHEHLGDRLTARMPLPR